VKNDETEMLVSNRIIRNIVKRVSQQPPMTIYSTCISADQPCMFYEYRYNLTDVSQSRATLPASSTNNRLVTVNQTVAPLRSVHGETFSPTISIDTLLIRNGLCIFIARLWQPITEGKSRCLINTVVSFHVVATSL
jgi:hypothetical protein